MPSLKLLASYAQEDLEPNAPSEEDFVFTYNADIKRLVEEGTVTNVGAVLSLEEVPVVEEMEVTCNSNMKNFVTYVKVEFDGDAAALSDMEIAILGILFDQVYNDISFANCDGYFRMTSGALLNPGIGSSDLFEVSGTCRDCPVDGEYGWSSMFANTRRRLHFMERLPWPPDPPVPSRTPTPAKK
ncbi:expressed unknown protein [Seminavis robusta]|uniref:Uncharacterized protein n=1 Tax=Seminavis robusta TaxID=568900 RepID=A0A9N8DP38_9STRA|nr:expressed unknown protein [Seminavis robusta]|eukprot:Sro187_g080870.1 n/a (185) ;mRNA; f:23654-24208